MSDTFQFKNNTLSLLLCEQPYTISLDEDTVAVCDSIRAEAREYLSKLNCESTDADTAILEICIFFEKCIDRLLGDGATRKIFDSRSLKLLDLTDLLGYILTRINDSIFGRVHKNTEA